MTGGWYAVQTASDTIELFRYDIHSDNGDYEHYAHQCQVKWSNGNCQVIRDNDEGGVTRFMDRGEFPWDMLRAIFNERSIALGCRDPALRE